MSSDTVLEFLHMGLTVALFLVVRGYLRRAEHVLERADDVLDVAKSYYEMGRAQHSDTRALAATITQRMDGGPALAQAVREVSEKADVVIGKLDKAASDSGTKLPTVRPE